jgi:RNA polymerase sigma-70 factor (ECF subfamily)
VAAHSSDSIVDAALLPADAASSVPDSVQSQVLALFDQRAPQLLRYVASFGLSAEETEDAVQDTFLALFRHLSLGRDRRNLSGWLFQVAHNLALKRRGRILEHLRSTDRSTDAHETAIGWHVDPAPDPEERLVRRDRRRRLRAVFKALPERERRCLFLRAEGLTYRDIAGALSVSLGTVSKAVSRALARLMAVDGG